MLISDHIDNTWSVDLSSEYKTYSGLICVVKHAIYVIGIRRINPYICKPDWCICVIEPMIWTGCVE